ncbi:MAG: hypothetical protein KIT84_27080 [Labilithrix sp.]|nr:hypothetical protein [Labilithrix sp.]MCW5814720.1 hypothetical protein [Labilithrix sp.]
MDRIRSAVEELVSIFRSSATKHEANRRAAPVMEQLTREPAFLTAVLERYLETPAALNRRNYPVVGVDIALNPWFGLVANCWIPLPSRETNVATKAIHHHGDMLLTTATLFGPGYEHWMFTLPQRVSGSANERMHSMELIEAAPHPRHHVSFVDAWTAHTPLYPRSLSITLALWSKRFPTTWRDRAKRLPIVKDQTRALTEAARVLGLRRALQLNVVESFDFFPVADGFEVMPERKEFSLGPISDHVHSVFHVVQETGNEHLARTIRRQVDRGVVRAGRPVVEELLVDLERGRPIAGKLSEGHYGVPYANFTRDDIERSLRATKRKESNVQHDHASPSLRQEAAGAGPR